MAVGNGNRKEMRPHCSWLVHWSGASGGPGHFTAITAPTAATTFFKLFFFLFLHFLPFDIYIYLYIFLHLEDTTIPIVPIWIQVWSLLDINVSFYSILGPGLGLLSQLHINVPSLLFVVYGFLFSFLHKSVRSVQRLLLYPDDGRHAGRPPQLPPQDVLAELRRVHASPAGAHDFKSSLLQPLEDLHGANTTSWLAGPRVLRPHPQPKDVSWSLRSCAARLTLTRPPSRLSCCIQRKAPGLRKGRREGAPFPTPPMRLSMPAAHVPVHLMVATTRQHGWWAHFIRGKTEAPGMEVMRLGFQPRSVWPRMPRFLQRATLPSLPKERVPISNLMYHENTV